MQKRLLRMLPDLRHFAEAEKLIPAAQAWAELGRDYLEWKSPLDIDGVTISGLQLRVGAHQRNPNEAVRVQLEFHPLKGRCEQLIRVEWRPLSYHHNKGRGPPPLKLLQFRSTHVHRFEDNWNEAKQRLLVPNLPIAVPIQDVDSFEEFLDICEGELRISNIALVSPPPWQRRIV